MDHSNDRRVDEIAEETPPRVTRTRLRDEPGHERDAGATPELFDPFTALLGAVLMVPNEHWGFEGVSSTDHPGACTHVAGTGRNGTLVKGTDAAHVRSPRGYLVVEPTRENGLSKLTAFELVQRYFRMHRLKLYVPGRCMGQLNGATLQALRAELARLHPVD